MKEIEGKTLREDFERLKKDRDELKKIKDRMEELWEIPEVREYVDLQRKSTYHKCGYINNLENRTDSEIIQYLIRNNKITPTTDIYYYVGSAMRDDDQVAIDDDDNLYFVDDLRTDAVYHKFYNIEEQYDKGNVAVVPSRLEGFKASHIVVFPTVLRDCAYSFNEASNEFFEISLTKGYDVAVYKFKEYSKTGYPWKTH